MATKTTKKNYKAKTGSTKSDKKDSAIQKVVQAPGNVANSVGKGLSNPEVTDKIAKGAAAIAITSGVVAIGAAMMNKDTRKKVGHQASVSLDKLSEYAGMLAEEDTQ